LGLETSFAKSAMQPLHSVNFYDANESNSFQRIVRQGVVAEIPAYLARKIIGGKAREAHEPGFWWAQQVPKAFCSHTVPVILTDLKSALTDG